MRKAVLVTILVFAGCAFVLKRPEPRYYRFCFEDKVKEKNRSEKLNKYFLEVNLQKKVFNYEIISTCLTIEDKTVTYEKFSGKVKTKSKTELNLLVAAYRYRQKRAGHIFEERDTTLADKYVLDTKKRTLFTAKQNRVVTFYNCPSFPSDSLWNFYRYWKN